MHMAYGVNFHNNVAMRGERVCYIFRIALLGEVSIVGSTWHLHLHLTDLISRESLGSSEHIFCWPRLTNGYTLLYCTGTYYGTR